MNSSPVKYRLLLWLLASLLTGGVLLSATMGFMEIGLEQILSLCWNRLSGGGSVPSDVPQTAAYVIFDVRLPRILVAVLVGAGLALSGVLYQGILLNPLADPYTLGISSGAAFGASLALLANLAFMGHFSIPLFAFAGAVATLFLVLYLASFDGQLSASSLILSGVIIGAILSAGISFLKYVADEQVAVIIFWLMGSFAAATWDQVLLVLASLLIGTAISLFYARDLNILSLGRRSSDSLGVNTGRVRIILLLTASLVTAVCVAVSGIIGFIGLIIPHLLRFIAGPDNRQLALLCPLAGGFLLLAADTLTRAILPMEVPIGVLTALLGGPFFCIIFRRKLKGSFYG